MERQMMMGGVGHQEIDGTSGGGGRLVFALTKRGWIERDCFERAGGTG